MRLKPCLLEHLLTPMAGTTKWCLGVAAIYTVVFPDPLDTSRFWPLALVVVHSISIAGAIAPQHGNYAYVLAARYDRSTLWRHSLLAAVLVALILWLPVALIVWTHLRSAVLGGLLNSPYYPYVMPRDMVEPFRWLGYYAIVLPPFWFARLRASQPHSLPSAYSLAPLPVLVAAALGLPRTTHFAAHPLLEPALWVLLLTASAIYLAGLRTLHRRMEVLP